MFNRTLTVLLPSSPNDRNTVATVPKTRSVPYFQHKLTRTIKIPTSVSPSIAALLRSIFASGRAEADSE